MKALPSTTGPSDRRDHLRAYLLACIRDNIVTPADLLSVGAFERLRSTFVADVRGVAVDVVRKAGAAALQVASLLVGGGRR